MMAATMFAAKETVLDINYAQLAVDKVTYEQQLTAVRNTEVSKKVGDVKVYPFSIEDVLEQNDVYAQNACLLRYKNTTTIGLFGHASNTTAFAIVNLKANDVVEIAYNNGSKDAEALTGIENMVQDEAEDEYVFNFTLNDAAKTLKYTVNTFTASADGQANFILPAGHLIAYIKVTRGEDDPEPEKEYEVAWEVNFAEFAATQIGTLGGSNITPTFSAETQKLMNVDVYSMSVAGLLEADKLYVNRNADMLVRYADIRTIGLYVKSTPTFVIPGLKKDDIVEIAWNAGGKGDGTYWEIDSTLTSLANVEVTGEWGEYAFSHTSEGTERTINYSTRQLKVQADGDIRFAVPSVKGDGQNWKIFVAYVKVLKEKAQETGIANTEAMVKAVKMIENGQVVIVRGGVKYNVMGVRL